MKPSAAVQLTIHQHKLTEKSRPCSFQHDVPCDIVCDWSVFPIKTSKFRTVAYSDFTIFDHLKEMASIGNPETLDQLFRIGMLQRRDKFTQELQNAPQFAAKLLDYEVFTDDERIAIITKPIRQHQKEALFYALMNKSFVYVDCIIQALRETENESLRALLLVLKIQIWKECPFDKRTLKVPPSFIAYDSYPSRPASEEASGGWRDENGDDQLGIALRDLVGYEEDIHMEDNDECVTILHQAASDGNTEVLDYWLKSTTRLPFRLDGYKRSPLHSAVTAKSSHDALTCIRMIIDRFIHLLEVSDIPPHEIEWKKSNFLNHQDNFGQSIIHLAAENESVEIVRRLYDEYHCDVFLMNNEGYTALEIMYLKTPQAVIHLLNGALPTTNNHPSDGNFTLEIDLRAVIGTPPQAQGNDKQFKYSETDLLAKLIHQNRSASKIILPHVIVKSFLDLKWEKMKFWLYSSMIIQIFIHLWYTGFVIQVFLIDCPHPPNKKSAGVNATGTTEKNTSGGENHERTIFNYLFGEWEPVQQVFSIFPCGSEHLPKCQLSAVMNVQAVALLAVGFIFLAKELFEMVIVNNMFSSAKTRRGKWRTFQDGVMAYMRSLENLLQLFFVIMMTMVCTLVFQKGLSDFYYSCAAFSIVVAWALILMQVGNIAGLGTYVQILGKVIKNFATLMGTYLVLIIAFSISFSIMFPHMEPFQTLPKSLSRVIIMMTGELNYDETFYDENDDDGGPPIPLAGHIIYGGFTLLLTIVLINLLIGMVVNDVQGLRGKSEVILRGIQVEQLYVMEKSLIRLRRPLLLVKSIVDWITGRKRHWRDTLLNIFVIDPANSFDGMVIKKSIKDFHDKQLQRELRSLATDANEYTEHHLKTYSS